MSRIVVRYAVSCLLALACFGTASGNPVAPSFIPGPALVQDVELLEKAFTRLHPGLHRYATPAQVTARFAALRRELKHGASQEQAYLAFTRFAASVRCGHTHTNFYNQPEAVQERLFRSGTDRLPFEFQWVGGRMVVTDGLGEPRLPAGSVVRRINGTRSERILRELIPLTRTDGHNEHKRVAQLEVRGEDEFEAFDVYYRLRFPTEGPFELEVQAPGQRSASTLVLHGLSHAKRREGNPAGTTKSPRFSLRFPSPGIAVLRMPTWSFYNDKWDWKDFLERSIAQVGAAQPRALVLDLRGNEGGQDEIGDWLISRLIESPVTLPPYRDLVRYRSVDEDLRPYLRTWDKSFYDWGSQAREYDTNFLQLTRWRSEGGIETIAPIQPRIAAPVFVLVDAHNSSATFGFARSVQRLKLGTLVGRATGGNLRGINGSAYFFLTLPKSQIEVDLPLVGSFPTQPQPDSGLSPDIAVTMTSADIASGRDSDLAAVLDDIDYGPVTSNNPLPQSAARSNHTSHSDAFSATPK